LQSSLAGLPGSYPEPAGLPRYNGAVASAPSIRELTDLSAEPAVRGFLHVPERGNGHGLVLTHGAGANCQSKLLLAVAAAFVEAGYAVLRCDLPFRQQRPHGPPFPTGAANDREGLRHAVALLKQTTPGHVYLGGHSYGGRQASMLLAEDDQVGAGLLLLSYPLHPPRKPEQLRVKHFSQLNTPALFVHGSRDPFGSIEELTSALKLIPARTELVESVGAGHELLSAKTTGALPAQIVKAFQTFFE
jgi:predicted alpha/beta-hydrolase family hydrolase